MRESGPVNPRALGAPKGYSNGILAAPGRVLFVAGQVAFDESQRIVAGDFVAQFARALDNVLAVVAEAGGKPGDLGRVTIYVTDKAAYVAATKQIGAVWRERMGKHYPAMTLVEVSALLEEAAMVEIEATAVIP